MHSIPECLLSEEAAASLEPGTTGSVQHLGAVKIVTAEDD